jgi:hypothetical protein
MHWGSGAWAGKDLAVWAKYVDEITLVDDGQGNSEGMLPGATGAWRITRRDILFMGKKGEEGVMGDVTE